MKQRLRHTPPVFRRNKWSIALWVAAIALLPLRVANAHLHLCLDGNQTPVSVHVEDVPTHFSEAQSADGHDDRDVQVPAAQAVVKADTLDQLTLACLAQSSLAYDLPARVQHVGIGESASPIVLAPSDLRPPPRGPPR